jgi:hypothetical protein
MAQLNINFLNPTNPFRFTDPIRKFKENDPYHYTVDNIPLKQLEENILWVKNVLDNATVDIEDGKDGVYRENFMELKPEVKNEGPANIVYVNPGRFTARINDAYNLTPLQVIARVRGRDVGVLNEWDVASKGNEILSGVLEKFKSSLADDAFGMNGLTDRSFVNPFTLNNDYIFNYIPLDGDVSPFSYTAFNLSLGEEYPNFFNMLWGSMGSLSRGIISPRVSDWIGQDVALSGDAYAISQNGRSLFYADAEFVKRWRGVARTAVVDVPFTLSTTIEAFDPQDFKYIQQDGSENFSLSSSVNSRIDLLFIYSKPIDQTGTYISEYEFSDPVSAFGNSPDEQSPRRLTKAELGIVQGAGLEVDFSEGAKWFFANAEGSMNRPEIVAHAADQSNTSLGFQSLNIHGSFPSPDDLMNLSPMIAEWLPKKHIALVGQTILPIAYIVVRNDATVNGIVNLTNNDILDIRPFFRTAELSYNERAGIAAALPSLSLANPVATESYVENEIKKVIEAIPPPPSIPLFTDQYNVIEGILVTKHLLATQQANRANIWPTYFGGQHYALWPSTEFNCPSSVPELDRSRFQQRMETWKSNGTGNQQLDGVFKPDDIWRSKGAKNYRYFIFTLNQVPALYGPQPDGTEWDIIIDGLHPIGFTNFAQTARNWSGGPDINGSYAQNEEILPGGVVTGTPTRTHYSTLQPLMRYDGDDHRNYFSWGPSHWVNNNNVGNYDDNHRLFSGTPNLNNYIPGWIVDNERRYFAGDQFWSDFNVVRMAVRPSNLPPILSLDPNQGVDRVSHAGVAGALGFSLDDHQVMSHPMFGSDIILNRQGVTLKRIYNAPAQFYGSRSVDIKFAVAVSNRISVKKLRFTLTNMRVR